MPAATVHPWLYDPAGVDQLVRARRPVVPSRSVVGDVVSDVVWSSVVPLLRWSDAALVGPPAVLEHAAWQVAAGAAELLRRLPGLSDELGEPLVPQAPAVDGIQQPGARLVAATEVLAGWLRGPEVVTLQQVADRVDRLGAAAVALLAARADWSGLSS